ncbi:MAG: hypothetical protein QG662_500 [Pseudomonadota bacterium]|nr:hypothetical protein [Pseudomonadota bacterium]
MISSRNIDTAGIVALALAFHRAPTQHADLLHGRTPLPPGVDILLKLAGGSAPDPAHAALASPDELKAAAMFFVEQVLFHHDVSHYRVLGVEPGASLDQIKEHHRLLMRVFHPDRDNRADDWKGAFATRINLAYSNLRDPDARQRHDAELKQVVQPGSPSRAARRATPMHRPAARVSRASGLPPIVMRHLPQWVLAGTALVAFGVVGTVYLDNPPAHTVAAGIPIPPAAPMRETAAELAPAVETIITGPETTALPPAPDALPQQPASIAAPAPMVTLMPASAPKPAPAPVQTPPRTRTPVQVATRPVLYKTPALPARATVSHQAPATAPQPAMGRAAQGVANIVPAPVLAQPSDEPALTDIAPVPNPQPEVMVPKLARPAPRTAEVATRPTQADPNTTLSQFKSSYERGDTQAFMSLFDEVAIGSAGGKSQIRRQHDSLFRTTDLRHIAIDGMAWSQEGDWIRGEGRYRKTQMPKGELKLQTETGIIRIELLRNGGRALIMGLDYQPGGRS